ncbi:MAG: RtcB family protein [Candidatus Micrarchaeaceae archaeon]
MEEFKAREISANVHEIEGKGVPVRIYANNAIFEAMKRDRTIMQALNASSLPGMVKAMLVMPDGHEGYGFPVGGVAAFDADSGIISPGAIGFDINCGVRLIRTNLDFKEVEAKKSELMDELFKNVPSGVGVKSSLKFSPLDLENIAMEGADYAIEKGYGNKEDLEFIEEGGSMLGADTKQVSDLAKKRGLHELGTLGAGNHFLEVQKVDKVFNEDAAKAFGLHEGQAVVMLHSGSRGYGHQICSDYLDRLSEYQRRNSIKLPDPELAFAFIGSREAEQYIMAMKAAVNYAFANRQVMTAMVRKSFEKVFSRSQDSMGMDVVYDVAHNIAKLEEHYVDGKRVKLYVHRKGATRAFAKNINGIPNAYMHTGQPVLIPGSMGTASYVLVGTEKAMQETFGSSCHGSGRSMSRHQAIKDIPAAQTFDALSKKGVEVRVRNKKLISEEAMEAYKNVDEVISSMEGAGLADAVARMIPIGVAKG